MDSDRSNNQRSELQQEQNDLNNPGVRCRQSQQMTDSSQFNDDNTLVGNVEENDSLHNLGDQNPQNFNPKAINDKNKSIDFPVTLICISISCAIISILIYKLYRTPLATDETLNYFKSELLSQRKMMESLETATNDFDAMRKDLLKLEENILIVAKQIQSQTGVSVKLDTTSQQQNILTILVSFIWGIHTDLLVDIFIIFLLHNARLMNINVIAQNKLHEVISKLKQHMESQEFATELKLKNKFQEVMTEMKQQTKSQEDTTELKLKNKFQEVMTEMNKTNKKVDTLKFNVDTIDKELKTATSSSSSSSRQLTPNETLEDIIHNFNKYNIDGWKWNVTERNKEQTFEMFVSGHKDEWPSHLKTKWRLTNYNHVLVGGRFKTNSHVFNDMTGIVTVGSVNLKINSFLEVRQEGNGSIDWYLCTNREPIEVEYGGQFRKRLSPDKGEVFCYLMETTDSHQQTKHSHRVICGYFNGSNIWVEAERTSLTAKVGACRFYSI